MRYHKINAKIGDTLKISDSMSLRYEKIAEDLRPIWIEIPPNGEVQNYEDGTYVSVTPDVWFVFERGAWRMMNSSEHLEANRQNSQDLDLDF